MSDAVSACTVLLLCHCLQSCLHYASQFGHVFASCRTPRLLMVPWLTLLPAQPCGKSDKARYPCHSTWQKVWQQGSPHLPLDRGGVCYGDPSCTAVITHRTASWANCEPHYPQSRLCYTTEMACLPRGHYSNMAAVRQHSETVALSECLHVPNVPGSLMPGSLQQFNASAAALRFACFEREQILALNSILAGARQVGNLPLGTPQQVLARAQFCTVRVSKPLLYLESTGARRGGQHGAAPP